MPNTSEKARIDWIRGARAKNDLNAVDLANSISKDIDTGFAGGIKYIFELLQNADDAATSKTELTITLQGGYLVFSHTGKHFTPEDVDKLCSYARSHRDKAEDAGTTGFKGIGFKAVFSISDCVTVISAGYSFRFDKSAWLDDEDPYPWQLLPIWTEEPPSTIASAVKPDNVNFIIRLRSAAQVEAVKRDLTYFLNNPQILLMLRRLHHVTIHRDGREQVIQVTPDEATMGQIWVDSTLHSTWVLRRVPVRISEAMKKELERLSDSTCPAKLKQASWTTITYAYRVRDGHLVSDETLPLYTYLPTETHLFPFIVNADFLLNSERTTLINNKWNRYLLRLIAQYHLFSLQKLAELPQWRKQVLAVLAPAQLPAHTKPEFAKAYQDGFKRGLREYAFIAVGSSETTLATIRDCWIDQLGFRQHLTVTDAEFPEDTRVEDELVDTHRLYALPGFKPSTQVLTVDRLLERLPVYAQQSSDLEYHAELMHALYTVSKRAPSKYGEQPFIERLQRVSCALTADNDCLAPGSLYFPRGKEALPAGLKVPMVHPGILANKKIPKSFLIQIGVSEYNPAELVSGVIKQALLATENPAQAVALLQYIFDAYRRRQVTKEDLIVLRDVKVLTIDGKLCAARSVYLSAVYQLHDKTLDGKLAGHLSLLSGGYVRPRDSLEQWCGFLRLLGVRNLFAVEIYKACSYEFGGTNLPGFRGYVRAQPVRSSSSHKSDDAVINLIYLPIVKHLIQVPELMHDFWKIIEANAKLLKKYAATYYRYASRSGGRNWEIENFFVYQLKSAQCFLCVDGKFYHANQLYAPKFRHLFHGILPVADVPIELSSVVAALVGFKAELTDIKDCQRLLQAVKPEFDVVRVKELHELVFRTLLDGNLTSPNPGDICLLSEDNQLRKVSQLRYVADRRASLVDASCRIKPYKGFSDAEMLQLCAWLGVRIEDKPTYKIDIVGECNEIQDEIFKHNDLVLPLLACYEAREHLKSLRVMLRELYQKFSRLIIRNVEAITLTDEAAGISKSVTVHLNDTVIYVAGRWARSLTKKKLFETVASYLGLSRDLVNDLSTIFGFKDVSDYHDWLLEFQLPLPDYDGLVEYMRSEEFSVALQVTVPVTSSLAGEVTDDGDVGLEEPFAVVALQKSESASEVVQFKGQKQT